MNLNIKNLNEEIPEILNGSYNEKCDIWAAGVVLYILLSGVPPFNGNTDYDIIQAVKKGVFSFDLPKFQGISNEAKDLINKMITTPENRLTAAQVLDHPWMKLEEKEKLALTLNLDQLKNFYNAKALQKATLIYIASQLNETEIIELGKLFRNLDKNNAGVLLINDLLEELKGMSDKEEIEQIVQSIDTDVSSCINYTEFLAATMDKDLYLKEEKVLMAFRMFNLDGSGKISANELKQVLGKGDNFKNMDQSFWEQMIQDFDQNGDD